MATLMSAASAGQRRGPGDGASASRTSCVLFLRSRGAASTRRASEGLHSVGPVGRHRARHRCCPDDATAAKGR